MHVYHFPFHFIPVSILDETQTKRQRELLNMLMGLMPRGVRHFAPKRPYFTGYEYATLYDWDQFFEGIVLGYTGYPVEYARNGIRLFLEMQREDGFVARSYTPGTGVYVKHNVMFKPFLAQLALLTVHQDDNVEWLEREGFYDKLKKFYEYWRTACDPRGQGLSVWHEAEQTGMDNHFARAGAWEGSDKDFCEGVDLNSYLVREAEALAVLAEKLGRDADAAQLRASAENRKEAMRKWLWDDELGFFMDRHARENRWIPIKYAGAFAALWAGVATPAQAERIVKEHLLNEREFWRPFPVPILSADDPGYSQGYIEGEKTTCCNWRANTWVPINYMTVHGLRSYGYGDLAADLAMRTYKLFNRGVFSEYYLSESGVGSGCKPFWGWSVLAIFLPSEIDLNVDPTRIAAENSSLLTMRGHFA